MKRAKIIEGRPFDWVDGARHAANVIDSDGEVNWRAAACADPGVLSCPFCDEQMWWEGTVVDCPTCGQRFRTDWRDVARKTTGRDPVVKRIDNATNANIVRILHDAYGRGERGEPFTLPPDCPPLIRGFAVLARGGSLARGGA